MSLLPLSGLVAGVLAIRRHDFHFYAGQGRAARRPSAYAGIFVFQPRFGIVPGDLRPVLWSRGPWGSRWRSLRENVRPCAVLWAFFRVIFACVCFLSRMFLVGLVQGRAA